MHTKTNRQLWIQEALGHRPRRGTALLLSVALGLARLFSSDAIAAAAAAGDTRTEQQCVQVLQSGASLAEKDAACARLKLVGTAQSIPALAALLTNEQLSHSARYALEPMSAPQAGESLIQALDKTTGLLKAGIINSLAVRREPAAVPHLVKALQDSDDAVAASAAAALGEIATADALAGLQGASSKKSLSQPVQRAVVDATLRLAQGWVAAGQLAQGARLFRELYDTQKEEAVRTAAYRGLMLASGEKSLELASEALLGKPGPAQMAALQLAHDLPQPGASVAFARLLPQLSPPVQADLIEALNQRNDPAAAPAIAALANSPSPQVRLAALTALGNLADATVVPLLAEAAAGTDPASREAARSALVLLRRGPVFETLLRELTAAKPAVQPELARALGERGERGAFPKLLALAEQGPDSARNAALLALAQLADQDQLAAIVKLVREAKDPDARARATEALNTACQHVQARRGRVNVEPLVAGLAGGSAEARAALLPVCSAFNEPTVREALRSAVADANAQVREAAVRALCLTTDGELLPDLVKLACSVRERNLRSLAIGACVRLATQEEGVKLSNAQKVEALQAILAAQPSAEEKRAVLAGLADVADVAALKLVEPMLEDTAVQGEAARAVIKVAPLLPDAAPAIAALKKVVGTTQDASTRQAAEVVLKQLQTGGGFITQWQVAGPYGQSGRDYAGLFDVAFGPEKNPPQTVAWRPLASGADAKQPWLMDLLKALGNRQECVAYSRTWIRSEQAQPARLELGSDDGVKVWLNDKLVFARNIARAVRPGSEKVDVGLHAGWNLVVLKITQHNQGWGFCVRLVAPDGSPLEGLQVDSRREPTSAEPARPRRRPAANSARRAAAQRPDGTFSKLQLTDKFWAEGADLGDFNRDGKVDVVSGPFWYEGPDFKTRHEIWPATNSFRLKQSNGEEQTIPGFEGALGIKNAYSECFLTFAYDFNGDGWPDVLVIGFPGKAAYWYENPKASDLPWPRHLVFDEVGNESPGFAEITGDGKPEILCCARGALGYLEADWKNPTAAWTFHPVTPAAPKSGYQKFMHGVGCGDINGDGRVDIVEKDGWWEQPASRQGDPVWVRHPFQFAKAAAQLLVYDVNGDGLNDVITSLDCHGYGLAWYEQARTNGSIDFRPHLIVSPEAAPNGSGISFTQPHALALADINGDGLMDFVTGKRFWAHGKNGGDPESDGYPAVLYWFELKRPAKGQAEFIPHLIDNDSGVGTQVTVGLIGDRKRPGIVVGNKKGLFVIDRRAEPRAAAR